MTTATSSEAWEPAQTTRLWQAISACLEEFIQAWDDGDQPPPIAPFANHREANLRRLVLIELIKVDLEYRAERGQPSKTIEQYLAEFPEIATDGIPLDLVYEEYHLRKRAGEPVDVEAYCERFPACAEELRRMLGIEAPHVSTTLISGETAAAIEINDQIDDFDILAQLGKGAFATVFLARQRSMQRIVALKVSADRGLEAQTLAQLDHPHIVRVYDQRVLAERGLRLLYMQYVPGGTLQSVVEQVRNSLPAERTGKLLLTAVDRALDERGQAPPTDSTTRRRLGGAAWGEVVCWIGARLATALDYAHRHGVLHRDIKPANVLLAADGTPKLVDFNIACCSKVEGASPAAYFGGSLAYMSPEQLEACNPSHERQPDELDTRSEVYSIGVLLWELASGRRPFPDETIRTSWPQLLSQMASQRWQGPDAAAIAHLPADLPPGLREILLKCLSPSPRQRYASAGELARQLELCLRPGAQRLLLAPRRSWRLAARKHPTLTLAAAAILPNALLSTLNIAYNVRSLIKGLPQDVQQSFWNVQMPVVNGSLYAVGLSICIPLCWPVLRALRRGTEATPEIRSKSLWMADYIFWVVLLAWALSGLIYPVWIDRQVPGLIGAAFRYHFFTSQLLFGLLAGTLAFFADAFITVRALHPALLRQSQPDDRDLGWLARLNRRVWRFFGVSVAVPLLSVAVLAGTELLLQKPKEAPDQGLAFGLLGLLGLLGFLLSFGLARAIGTDIAALALALAPTGEALPGETQRFDPFTGSSRV